MHTHTSTQQAAGPARRSSDSHREVPESESRALRAALAAAATFHAARRRPAAADGPSFGSVAVCACCRRVLRRGALAAPVVAEAAVGAPAAAEVAVEPAGTPVCSGSLSLLSPAALSSMSRNARSRRNEKSAGLKGEPFLRTNVSLCSL